MQMTKTQTINKRLVKDQIKNILNLFQSYSNPKTIPSSSELEHYFVPHVHIISNDRTVCKDINDFLLRIRDIQKKFPNVKYSHLLEEPIVEENKAVIRYDVDFGSSSKGKTQFQVIAILTFEADRISQWIEVLHEKGTGDWDS